MTQLVSVVKSGDRLTVLVRQKYHPRGVKREDGKGLVTAYRWVMGGVFFLSELSKEEKRKEKQKS